MWKRAKAAGLEGPCLISSTRYSSWPPPKSLHSVSKVRYFLVPDASKSSLSPGPHVRSRNPVQVEEPSGKRPAVVPWRPGPRVGCLSQVKKQWAVWAKARLERSHRGTATGGPFSLGKEFHTLTHRTGIQKWFGVSFKRSPSF